MLPGRGREAPQHAVVTGATGGLGRWLALGLSGAGLRVALIGRDADRLDRAADWIAARTGRRPDPIRADLSSLSETRQAAEQAMALMPSIDILAANAGTLSRHRTETAEGHELTLAVNLLSPVLLLRCLLPALQAAPAARVVLTGSSSSDAARIDPDDLELHRGWGMTRAYARSKLALLMVAMSLAERTPGIAINVAHPGLVATGLVRLGGIEQLVWRGLSAIALTEAQGADTPLHAALSPEMAGITGRYLKRRSPAPPNPRALDPALRDRVLAATDRLIEPV